MTVKQNSALLIYLVLVETVQTRIGVPDLAVVAADRSGRGEKIVVLAITRARR